jgi:GTP-binding protein LepA
MDNPARLPEANHIEEIREPIILANILVPQDLVGPVMTLCEEKRGNQRKMHVPRQTGTAGAMSCP